MVAWEKVMCSDGQFKGLASSERKVDAVEAALQTASEKVGCMPVLGSCGRDQNLILLLVQPVWWKREDQEKEQKEEPQKTAEHTSVKEAGKASRSERRPSQSALSSRNDRKSAKSPQKTDAPKENKHPFALYGWGERQTDTGSQKTHNVCASASANEIHESALRAKNRRQVEKRKLSQRRVRSAEAEKALRIKPSPPDNPWMTEYMRCYSARAR
ncbi:PREDICTED: centriole, cilia and spindle-associated protein [Chlamydotis macqueenii]|uniref:centriole, cilia and spindle-associated protein n=1 Tax=Chlamydotis macqueenii TaxID=187382 RepID=UPI000529F61B|nr:PREDICTED: centriole, cilia and spindle-associated protein [Chlamydotis macqueenii]